MQEAGAVQVNKFQPSHFWRHVQNAGRTALLDTVKTVQWLKPGTSLAPHAFSFSSPRVHEYFYELR